MSQTALVTGGAGFIGSHVADRFLAAGYGVTILDSLASGKAANVPAGAEFIDGDITSSAAAALVRERRFDVVLHCAAQIDVRKSVADPMHDARINVIGTLNLLEAIKASGAPARFVFSSTGGALYGDFVSPPSREEMPKDPESPYGIAKLSAELYMAHYARTHRLDTVALRYANVYGPRQDAHGDAGVVAVFCGRLLRGEPLTVYGDGLQTRDYVYVGDVAEANFRAATAALPAPAQLDVRAFNIGTGVETSVLDLASTLATASGQTGAIHHLPARPGEILRSALVAERARTVLGWTPRMSLADGLAETYRYFAAQMAATAA
ncbi:MAG: GDP-mannose 4,6-dehydratase [Gemmatimonadaceae bacterium]|jgi:UDP-glucose 4-epimerase|nr:GDP-mannose 4,6-dehydratase [Gemmatimonadaceae bacterium]